MGIGSPLVPSPLLRAASVIAIAAAALSGPATSASATVPAMPPQRIAIDAYAPSPSESGCAGGDTAGIRTFKALLQRAYPGVEDYGDTYVCKGVSGHSVGRAWDWRVDVSHPVESAIGWETIGWLLATDEHGNRHAMARRLGVAYLIWDNKIWSSAKGPYTQRTYYPDSTSKVCSPADRTCLHLDHVHFSLSAEAGAEVTTGYVEHYMGPDAVSQQSAEQGVYFRGGSSRSVTPRQRYRWFTAATGWSSEVDLGSTPESGPSVTSWGPSRVDVFHRGGASTLLHRWWDGTWQPLTGIWEDLGAPPGGATSGPDAASWSGSNGNRHINVFVRGADKALWMRTYNSSSCPCGWGEWESLGGVLTSDPGAISTEPGRIDVFVRGTDDAMWHRAFVAGSGWAAWASRGGLLRGAPDAAANGDKPWVAVRGVDDAVHRITTTASGAWSGWSSLGPPPGGARSDPTALARDGELHVWVRGNDGRLWERYWIPAGWSGWVALASSQAY